MGAALETLPVYVTSLTGSTTFNPVVYNSGQSGTIRSYEAGSASYLEDVWASAVAHPFQLSIKSPRMADQTKGLLMAGSSLSAAATADIFNPQTLMPGYLTQRVYSTDILTVTANGTASDTFVGVLNVRYENLGGVTARLATWGQIYPNIRNMVGILTQPTASATAGLLGTGVALNSVDDRLWADTDYALCGILTSVPLTCVCVTGVDVGNLQVGCPGFWDQEKGADFFVRASNTYQTPHIPVFNSNNKGGIFISTADVAGATAANVTLIFAQLNSKFTG